MGVHVSCVSSTGVDSGQEADTAAESTGASVATGPDGLAYSPGWRALTSCDMQEERALKQCTFVPRLNSNKAARSIVAHTWKRLPADYHLAAAIPRNSGASQTAVCLKDGRADEAVAAASAAASHARGGNNSVTSDTHKDTQGAEAQIASAVGSNSSSRKAHRRKQLFNSYAAAAGKSKAGAAAVCSAVPAGVTQQQPHVGSIGSGEECEAELQAEVAACDKRLEQCMAARKKARVTLNKAMPGGPAVVAASGAQQQQDSLSNHSSEGRLQQSALRVIIEAELADGSASRFEVQQV